MLDLQQFFVGGPIVFEGSLVKEGEDGQSVVVQLHPGLNIELRRENIENLEEATDPVTGRTYMRVTLKPDTEITAVFQPRLARLALSVESGGVPFGLGGAITGIGGAPVGMITPPVPAFQPPPPPPPDNYPKLEPWPPGSYSTRVRTPAYILTKFVIWGYVRDYAGETTVNQVDYPLSIV